jgi:hypothetical protein
MAYDFNNPEAPVYNPFAFTEFGKRMQDNPDPTQISLDPSFFQTSPVKNYFTSGIDFSSSEAPIMNEGAQNRNQQGKSDMNALMEAHQAVQSLYDPTGGTPIAGNENIRVKVDPYGRPYTTVSAMPSELHTMDGRTIRGYDAVEREKKATEMPFGIPKENIERMRAINEQQKAKEETARREKAANAGMIVSDIKAERKAMGFDPETNSYDPSMSAESGIDVQSGDFMRGIASRKAEQAQKQVDKEVAQSTGSDFKKAQDAQIKQMYYRNAAKGIGSGRVAMGKYGYAQSSNAPTTTAASVFLQNEAQKRGMNAK